MAIAFLSAERSKDPNRQVASFVILLFILFHYVDFYSVLIVPFPPLQVGACLVSQNGIILGMMFPLYSDIPQVMICKANS